MAGEVIDTTAVAVRAGGELANTGAAMRDPDAVLAEATRAAQALAKVISGKAKKVVFNNEQYLEFEDWQTLGRFYGVTVKAEDPEYVALGPAHGFRASAVVLDARGAEISRATSYCMDDEEKWSTRTKYEFAYVLKSGGTSVEDPGPDEIVWEDNPSKPGKKRPKKERVKVGDEKVPVFQLASMAQTRACAKALRNVLSWVAVLAGYRPTPAEEMEGVRGFHREGDGAGETKTAGNRPPAASAAGKGAAAPPASSGDDQVARGIVQRVFAKDGKKPWGVYVGDAMANAEKYTTFSDTVGKDAANLKGAEVVLTWKPEGEGGKFRTLLSIAAAAAEPAAEAGAERSAEDEAFERELAEKGL